MPRPGRSASTSPPRRTGSARGSVETTAVRSHAPRPEAIRQQQDRALLEGQPTEAVLEAARRGARDPALSRRLAALFRMRPEAIPPALAIARDGAAPSARLVLDALGAGATRESVGALGRFAHDATLPVPRRVDALAALVHVQRPSQEQMRVAFDLLSEPEPEIRRAALLMSGALARAGRTDLPMEAAEIEDALAAHLREATGAQERVSLLKALGNSAGPRAVGAARVALSDARPEVRAAAVEALRLSDDPAVDGLIVGAISGDADPRVRAAGIFAAGFRPAGRHLAAVEQAARGDASEVVRSRAVSLLRQRLEGVPELAGTLAIVARTDPSPGIRRLAREALDARRTPSRGAAPPSR